MSPFHLSQNRLRPQTHPLPPTLPRIPSRYSTSVCATHFSPKEQRQSGNPTSRKRFRPFLSKTCVLLFSWKYFPYTWSILGRPFSTTQNPTFSRPARSCAFPTFSPDSHIALTSRWPRRAHLGAQAHHPRSIGFRTLRPPI
jgi:hypothetical protein